MAAVEEGRWATNNALNTVQEQQQKRDASWGARGERVCGAAEGERAESGAAEKCGGERVGVGGGAGGEHAGEEEEDVGAAGVGVPGEAGEEGVEGDGGATGHFVEQLEGVEEEAGGGRGGGVHR
ncbi:glycine-rich cell wall structural protein 1.8-like [Ananas comosus]|uniref:Glycine-rich cell wall structural protein 1.8-like n=1 Tax=Ananas comosus TaxID=4615 RepID=A0A6P5H7F3_ANACO|nr:glycine-rich cell wall structural protein 1.8-like [Ananas comosus]